MAVIVASASARLDGHCCGKDSLRLAGERGSLKTQMISSAESIAFNIVEGCGAATSKEFARFLDVSIKSTGEPEYQLELATDADLLSAASCRPLGAEAIEIRRMLCALRRRVLEPPPRPDTDD